mmetsp:Transcript_28277/g.90459  ORF Transcript_28277/g.90459 Transcript_28277/m.90459 type:complete len:219 (+) Transcript_28277:687-1343(+)
MNCLLMPGVGLKLHFLRASRTSAPVSARRPWILFSHWRISSISLRKSSAMGGTFSLMKLIHSAFMETLKPRCGTYAVPLPDHASSRARAEAPPLAPPSRASSSRRILCGGRSSRACHFRLSASRSRPCCSRRRRRSALCPATEALPAPKAGSSRRRSPSATGLLKVVGSIGGAKLPWKGPRSKAGALPSRTVSFAERRRHPDSGPIFIFASNSCFRNW